MKTGVMRFGRFVVLVLALAIVLGACSPKVKECDGGALKLVSSDGDSATVFFFEKNGNRFVAVTTGRSVALVQIREEAR